MRERIPVPARQVLRVTATAATTVLKEGDASPTAMAAGTSRDFGPLASETIYTLDGADFSFTRQTPSIPANLEVIEATLTPASVSANTSAEQTFTVTGVDADDKVAAVSSPNLGNATYIGGCRVSAANQVAIRFGNPTAGALTPASGTYKFLIAR